MQPRERPPARLQQVVAQKSMRGDLAHLWVGQQAFGRGPHICHNTPDLGPSMLHKVLPRLTQLCLQRCTVFDGCTTSICTGQGEISFGASLCQLSASLLIFIPVSLVVLTFLTEGFPEKHNL